MVEATIEDLAFRVWSSREVDKIDPMSECSELRSSREDQTENGVKNLKGAKPFPKPHFNPRWGNQRVTNP